MVKRLVLILAVIAIALQFIRPSLDNPPVTADFNGPADVKAIFQRSCYNCHSNQTKLAWFDEIVPAYWMVASHVKEGRAVLNFSNWDQQKGKLFEALNQMTFQTMPLASYRFVHHDAVLNDGDLATLRAYLLTLPRANITDTARTAAGDRQYARWMSASYEPVSPTPAPNSIAFPTGFENWEVLGTSERFDNGTMRVILANPTAIQAFRNGQTNPWPDGATFAKIAWDEAADDSGHIRTGEFKQVEFMIKDAGRYSATDGWGWARWVKGLALTPYGKTAAFTSECMNCHQPMKDHDFFFSLPPAPVAPAGYALIASSIDKGTMTTLYGNPQAVAAARKGASYPQDATFLLATWTQKEDPHWFGAHIPGALLSTTRRLDSVVHIRASVLP